ncbi:hypothetical protein MENTO_v1c05700 [Mesoplasma entomophilum]|uniref:Uncharacterized protein n=1 Tax=Mesoplasma entomophilum TaxID=2149 RepID=A0A3S5Y092_9MOLU|nr:hypothetical protein CS528_02990 [Mesoplasma entomophilum]ATZ19672.1 hypothetical protein MENTO_v1c05700 [Mesoplasma entomophilum]
MNSKENKIIGGIIMKKVIMRGAEILFTAEADNQQALDQMLYDFCVGNNIPVDSVVFKEV